MGWTPCEQLFVFMFAYALADEKHHSALFLSKFVYYFVVRPMHKTARKEHEMFAVRSTTEWTTGVT